eukprot:TRINITY_DN5917_c0_g4_i1.p2 TRINITY_DN5917_c0_g4~~TRINITY_DN5917_c0_g4_i1.p2  ORF type:complete len:138 (-),score=60.12 TRINITY_DN5917_c0_g4_i1:42-455(-)
MVVQFYVKSSSSAVQKNAFVNLNVPGGSVANAWGVKKVGNSYAIDTFGNGVGSSEINFGFQLNTASHQYSYTFSCSDRAALNDGEVATNTDNNSSSGLSGGAIAGIVIGCVVGVALIAVIAVVIVRKNSNYTPVLNN